MPEQLARILVEGGPVHRRVNRVLAGLIGLGIGFGSGRGCLVAERTSPAHEARNASLQAQTATAEVQRSRYASLLTICEEGNARNRATVREYDRRIARAEPRLSKARRAQLQAQRQFTVGLIDALSPVRNCPAYARKI